jgi:hypothetical protein
MNWTDNYTSKILSEKILRIKGKLPSNDPYWKADNTFMWDMGDPRGWSLWQDVYPNMALRLYHHSYTDNMIPAYHILQDICCEYSKLFLKDGIKNSRQIFELYKIGLIGDSQTIEDFILDNLNPEPFDQGGIKND